MIRRSKSWNDPQGASDHETIQHWLEALQREGKSDHTIAAYRRALRHFVWWCEHTFGDGFDPAATIGRDVRDWKSYQQTVEKAQPATINQRLAALSQFFRWAVATGHARTDPTRGITGVRLSPRRPKALSETELRRLFRAVHAGGVARDIAIVEMLAGTGLRVSELLALTVGDVQLGARSGRVIVRRGKRESYRVVPLSAPVRAALRAYLATHPQANDPAAPLWLGERGALRTRSAVVRLLEKYTLAARLGAIGPHTLRHTFATRYLAANPDDLRGLARLLGHSSLNTVMLYTEPTEEALAARVERVDPSAGRAT